MVPVPMTERSLRALMTPTLPVKSTAPVPGLIVRSSAVATLSTVLPNVTSLLVVVNVVLEFNVTAPVYVCAPTVVTPVVFM